MTSETGRRTMGARVAALLGCLLLLTGWRIGPPLTYFEEQGSIPRAIEALRAKGGFSRVLSIDIAGGRIDIEAQDRFNNRRVNRWTITRESFYALNWEELKRPEPVPVNALPDRDFDSTFFDIGAVDFAAAERLIKDAPARAALEERATIEGMTIRRQVRLLPKATSGDIRWSVSVRSERESASVLADGKGRITGLDLTGTERARTFDLLASLDKLPEAARAFAESVGTGPVLVEARITRRDITFKSNIPDTSPAIGSFKQLQVFTWGVNGLERVSGTMDTSQFFGAAPAFGIGDVDWTAAGKLVQQAREGLQMPDAALDDIELEKPGDQPGAPKVEWQITFKDANGEEGTARFDARSGEVLGRLLPESRRKPFDARDPGRWPELLAKIEQTLGADGPIAELLINDSQVTITAADPLKPEELAEFLLDDEGIRRFGTASPFALENPRFTVAEIRALTGEQMGTLIDATARRLGLPATQVVNITIGKASLDPSPQGNVTVEIRVGEGPSGRSGRVNWEIDGREIKAYLP